MKSVLVMGASGRVGREVVAQALAAGHRVRAFARSAEDIAIEHDRFEAVNGDALDPEATARALDGMEVVIQALGVPASAARTLRRVELFSEATRVLVPAMQQAGAHRLVCLTGFGAGDSRARMGCFQSVPFRLFLGRAYDDKDRQERLVKESGLDWVLVRPGILTNGSHSGRYKVLVEPRSWRNGVISRADVADFMVRQVGGDAYLGKSPVLTY